MAATLTYLDNQDRKKSILLYLVSGILIFYILFGSVVIGQEREAGSLALGQNIPQADTAPQSILFPSDLPGPYFPNANEINQRAPEEQRPVSNGPGESVTELNDGSLEVMELPEEDSTLFGTIRAEDGGFATTMWRRSEIDKIEKLISVLNLPLKSPAMDDISRKLLLSVSSAPIGTSLALETASGGQEILSNNNVQEFDERLAKKFINLRINELMERGNLSDLMAFIQSLPEEYLEVNKNNAEILLLGGDLIGACQLTRVARSQASPANGLVTIEADDSQNNNDVGFWLKMLAFCRAMEEDKTGAQIALDLFNEQGGNDFVFFDLISILMEEPSIRPTFISNGLTSLDPLNYSILSLLDQPIEAELIENGSPLVISALVINPNMSDENRFQAAVKSFLNGGILVSVLSDIYGLQEFSESEYANAVRIAQFDERPLADAMLYQAASRQGNDVAKAEILKVMWERAIAKNDLPRSSLLNIQTLLSINPSNRLINHAHHITRGLLLAGEFEKASQWYNFVRRNAVGGDAEATRALINIWPLVVLASERGDIPWNDDILDLWWNGQMVLSPENRDSKAALFYALAEAFQYDVSEDKWLELITNNYSENRHAIPLGVWRDMILSVQENKFGQSVILSLIAASANGPGGLDASGISAVIRTLRSFGLEKEARSIALEAMVSNDF